MEIMKTPNQQLQTARATLNTHKEFKTRAIALRKFYQHIRATYFK